jgi:mannose-6-phosphate isomerase-like protein (cupin superfamily)
MSGSVINLVKTLESFDDVYSPRIVARVNDYDVRVAHALGEHVWHRHPDTDEFFLVLGGRLDIGLRDDAGEESTVSLGPGEIFVVPKGVEHRPNASEGADILLFEPTGTSSTGDHEGELPGHVDSTTGHSLT